MARNVRCRGGERDLIADDGRIVFVEVRLRRTVALAARRPASPPAKQQRVILAAQHWLAVTADATPTGPCRFDAILLDGLDAGPHRVDSRGLMLVAPTAPLACALAAPASAQQIRILVQSSPLAGFQYYGGKILWDEMREGDRLASSAKPDNRHDPSRCASNGAAPSSATCPAATTGDVAEEMDRGTPIAGRIGRPPPTEPWKRVRVDVYVGL